MPKLAVEFSYQQVSLELEEPPSLLSEPAVCLAAAFSWLPRQRLVPRTRSGSDILQSGERARQFTMNL